MPFPFPESGAVGQKRDAPTRMEWRKPAEWNKPGAALHPSQPATVRHWEPRHVGRRRHGCARGNQPPSTPARVLVCLHECASAPLPPPAGHLSAPGPGPGGGRCPDCTPGPVPELLRWTDRQETQARPSGGMARCAGACTGRLARDQDQDQELAGGGKGGWGRKRGKEGLEE